MHYFALLLLLFYKCVMSLQGKCKCQNHSKILSRWFHTMTFLGCPFLVIVIYLGSSNFDSKTFAYIQIVDTDNNYIIYIF